MLMLAAPAAAPGASRIYLDGRGFGHGIGMSQYGARGMADHGWGYDRILGHYFTGTGMGTLEGDRPVRVLVSSGGSAVLSGAARINDLETDPGTTYTIARGGSGLAIRRGDRTVATVSGFVRAEGPGPITVAGLGAYRGAIEVRGAGGGVNVINAVGLDDYARGVIAGEMPASWHPEALKAQAVAARSYAVTTSKAGDGFEQYADTRSQVYNGVRGETARTDRAVQETKGQVVTRDGAPVTTYFFSTSGGYTENVEFSFIGSEPRPWLKGVDDPFEKDAGSPRHTWRLPSLSLPRAQAKLGGLVKGRLRGIEVTKRGASPRVVYAQIIGTRGRTRVKGSDLKSRFGLPDTWVSFTGISATPGPRPPTPDEPGTTAPQAPGGGAAPGVGAALATVDYGGVARRSVTRTLVGEAHPATEGLPILVQRRTRGAWETVARVRLRRGGRYIAGLPGPGTYRARFRRHAGPPVRVR